jgi:hypothetical protein
LWRAALALAGMAVALLVLEGASRLLFPVAPAIRLERLDGAPLKSYVEPGARYRQVANEFDALTTITADGYRVPDAGGQPCVVFLGDSFTFGHGLPDEQTFPYLYCDALALRCANLGHPQMGTGEEIDRLEEYLSERGWRPRHVKLFLYAMTGSFAAGNDLADNLAHRRRAAAPAAATRPAARPARPPAVPWQGLPAWLFDRRDVVLRHSNLARIAKFYWGPQLRDRLSPAGATDLVRTALDLTGEQLARLQRLSERYGFEYRLYLLHPMQDVSRGTADATHAALTRVAPAPIEDLAPVFAGNPAEYYYSYDLHFNSTGSAAVADHLITADAELAASLRAAPGCGRGEGGR